MRNAYVTMIGGTLLLAAVLGAVGTLVVSKSPVSPVSAKDAATASSGSASQQAASLEAAELEARENPPPPSPNGVVQGALPDPTGPGAASLGYQGSAPTPSIQFSDVQPDAGEEPPVPTSTVEE